jgi:hypothetical protein
MQYGLNYPMKLLQQSKLGASAQCYDLGFESSIVQLQYHT